MHFLYFMSDIKLCFEEIIKKNPENYIQQLIDICICGVISYNILHAYWLNYFSHVEGVLKAIENTWKLIMFTVLYLILRFTRSSAYHQEHTKDTFELMIILLSMQHCQEIATGRVKTGWLCSRSTEIITKLTALMCNHPFLTLLDNFSTMLH